MLTCSRVLLAVALTGLVFGSVPSATAQPKKEAASTELPADLISQFEALGGEYGHFEINNYSEFEFKPVTRPLPGEMRLPFPFGPQIDWDASKLRAQDLQRSISLRLPGLHFDYETDDKAVAALPASDKPLGLHFRQPRMTRTGFKGLSKFSQLLLLDLSDSTYVSDMSWANLSKHSFSEDLTDLELGELRGLKRLRFLALQGTQLSDSGLADLTTLTELQSIDLSRCDQVTEAGLKQLPRLKSLRSLHLGNCDKLSDAGLKHLALIAGLRSLDLAGNSMDFAAGMKELTKLPDLQNLDLSVTELDDEALKELGRSRGLRSLHLSSCKKATDKAFANLGQLRELQELTLDETLVGDETLKQLGTLPKLRFLDLEGCENVGDAGLEGLAGAKSLERLYLTGCKRVGDAGVKALAKLPRLSVLFLTGNENLTNAALRDLANAKSLQWLDITNCPKLDQWEAYHLKQALPNCEIRSGNPAPRDTTLDLALKDDEVSWPLIRIALAIGLGAMIVLVTALLLLRSATHSRPMHPGNSELTGAA